MLGQKDSGKILNFHHTGTAMITNGKGRLWKGNGCGMGTVMEGKRLWKGNGCGRGKVN